MYTSPRGLRQHGKGLEAPLGRTSLILALERYIATRNQICAEPLWFRLPILVCSKGAVGLEKVTISKCLFRWSTKCPRVWEPR